MHIDSRRGDAADSTLTSTEYRLSHFVRWCDQTGIDSMEELTREHMHDYRVWRREDGDLAPASEKTQMDTLRVFIRWCGRMGIVSENLDEAVISPTLDKEDKRSTDIVDHETAQQILDYLDRYKFASREHVLFVLAWQTGLRTGGLRAIDLDDYSSDDEAIEIVHRPDSETPLKNKSYGERFVALKPATAEIVDEWIAHNRPDVTDDHGREPLIATRQGRISKNAVRGSMYRLTRPCVFSTCPHGREEDECKAAQSSDYAYECPSSTAAHSVRRGAITHMLRNDVPDTVVSDRCNVSDEVIDQHYDRRTEHKKMEQRRGYLDNI